MSTDQTLPKGSPAYQQQKEAWWGEIEALTISAHKRGHVIDSNYFQARCKTEIHAPNAWGSIHKKPFFSERYVAGKALDGSSFEIAKTKARNPKSHGHDVNLWYPRPTVEVS